MLGFAKLSWLTCLWAVFWVTFFADANDAIYSVAMLTPSPRLYERMDFTIQVGAQWTNSPYHSAEVQLDLDLESPSGTALVVPAFYDSGPSGGMSLWKVRFTPMETGTYRGIFVITNNSQRKASSLVTFTVTSSDRKGFLHVNDDWTFRFSNGQPFRGIGENIGWESRSQDDSRYFRKLNESPSYNYDYLLGRLATNGGNFFRTWMCPWNLPLEWKTVSNTNRYSDDNGYFNASAIQRMDQLVDLADARDVYIMLTLDNSGDFQGWGWRHSSYNRMNGGAAETPQDFFTNPQSKGQYKDRLRYLVARWGYSPHIAAWEFFNEIDNLMYGLPQKIPDDVVTSWHQEMTEYLKDIDPFHHLITTSISHREVAGLYRIATIDFNQIHIYGHNGQSRITSFPEVLRRNSGLYDKPYIIGEYGFEWDWNKNFDDFASSMDGDFKKGLWLGLFSPTPILPMSWWWEYFDHRNVSPYIARVRLVLDEMLAAGGGTFADADCKWKGPPARAMAVRCGNTFFVLLMNDGNAPITGSVSLPLEPKHRYRVSVYDPDRDLTQTLAAFPEGVINVNGISVAAGSELILIASPQQFGG